MNVTAQELLDNYPTASEQVITEFENLDPSVKQQHEASQSVTYWFARACQIGRGIVASTPPQFTNTGEILVIDTWGWVPPETREKMAQENHVFWQAFQQSETGETN